MICSFNELQNAVGKAARGGGLSWGLAEDAGRAAVWLAARQILPQFSAALVRRERFCLPEESAAAKGILTPSVAGKMLCPFFAGAYLADCGGRRWVLRRAAFPLIIAPFAARAAAGRCVSISWEGAILITDGENIAVKKRTGLLSHCADIEIAPCANTVFLPPLDFAGCKIEAAEWRKLQTLAARTFMPSDEKSRAEDAGGADSD